MKRTMKKRTTFLMTMAMFACLGSAVLIKNSNVIASAQTPTLFAMQDGASVKVDSNGLRFRVKMDEETATSIKTDDTKTLVAYLAPTTLFNAVADGKYVNLSDKLTVNIPKENIYQADDGYYWANACVYNVKEVNRTLTYSAVACIVDSDASAEDAYTYATITDNDVSNIARSQYYVINSATLDGKLNANTKSQVATTYSWYGTQEYPIFIETETAYNAFVTDVNNGNDFNGKYYYVKEGVESTVEMTGTLSSAKVYSVTFNTNGGSSVAMQYVAEGQSAQVPATPTKQDFIFDGWMLDGTTYNFGAVTGDITLTAKWKVNTSSSVSVGKLTFSAYPNATEYKVYYGESEDACNSVLNGKYVDMENLTADISSTATTVTQRIAGKSAQVYYQVKAIVGETEESYSAVSTTWVLIDTADDLNNLRQLATSTNGYTIGGNYYLAHDIDWEGKQFSLINANLSGIIDGNGFAIKKLKLKELSSGQFETSNYFLHCVYPSGAIKNICFDEYGSYRTSTDGKGSNNGALVNRNQGTLENVVVRAKGYMIYGFKGLVAQNDTSGIVENCILDTTELKYRVNSSGKDESKNNSTSAFITANNAENATISNCYVYSTRPISFWATSYMKYTIYGLYNGSSTNVTNAKWYVNSNANDDKFDGYENTQLLTTQQEFADELYTQVNANKLSQTAYNIYCIYSNCIKK